MSMTEKQNLLARRGLTLPRRVLRRLNEVGIFAQPHVSLEHQHLAGRYVVRGIESGGAVREVGRYITFSGPTGEPLPYLHPIDSIGVNGVHAVVIAPILVRIELFRAGRTCQLLITRHKPGKAEDGRRPPLENSVLFRGVDGFFDAEQDHRGTDLSGTAMPRFWSRAGEEREIPILFAPAVRAAALGSTCYGCSHTHFSVAPVMTATTADVSGK
jgi:hypothetical protein